MSINLLPWREEKRKAQLKKLRNRVTIYSIILFFSSLFIKLFLYIHAQHTHFKILQLNHQISGISLNDPLHKNESLLKKLSYFHAQQKNVKQQNASMQHSLFQIANVIPNTITLDQLIINAKKILLTGKSDQLADIHHYVNALQTATTGKAVQLTNIQSDEKNHSIMRFTIEIDGEQQHEQHNAKTI